MQNKRDELLKLDSERKEIEKEIFKLTEYLTGEGMPGVDGSLVDKEGFPLPNLDLYSIREARHTLIMKQNDLKHLMETIESKMAIYFTEINQNKPQESVFSDKKKEEIDDKEPIAILAPQSKPKFTPSSETYEPFATVTEVTSGSPAEESGLIQGDSIISFDTILTKGKSPNPLQTLAKLASDKINQKIPVKIIRKNSEGILEAIDLSLIPHHWSGRGILGCKLNLL